MECKIELSTKPGKSGFPENQIKERVNGKTLNVEILIVKIGKKYSINVLDVRFVGNLNIGLLKVEPHYTL